MYIRCSGLVFANFTSPKGRIALQVARKIASHDRAKTRVIFLCVYFFRKKFPAGRTNEHKCCYMGQIIEEGDTTELSDNHDDAESWYNWNILGHIQVGESNITSIARFRG